MVSARSNQPHRRHFFATSATAALGAALTPRLTPSTLRTDGQAMPLRRNVHLYTNRGGTIAYLDTPDALVAVDTQFPDAAQAFATAVNAAERRIDLLVNTHHHGDHTGGNATLAPLAERFIAHERVPLLQRRAAEARADSPPQAYATETFTDETRIDVGDETVHFFHYGPGHTGGDAVVLFERARVAHLGDLVFNRRHPYIDVNGGEADTENWQRVLGRIYEGMEPSTLFVFGHSGPGYGVVGTRDDLKAMQAYLAALVAYVTDGMAAGKSLDELKVEQLPSAPDTFAISGSGVATNIEAVWKERSGG